MAVPAPWCRNQNFLFSSYLTQRSSVLGCHFMKEGWDEKGRTLAAVAVCFCARLAAADFAAAADAPTASGPPTRCRRKTVEG